MPLWEEHAKLWNYTLYTNMKSPAEQGKFQKIYRFAVLGINTSQVAGRWGEARSGPASSVKRFCKGPIIFSLQRKENVSS